MASEGDKYICAGVWLRCDKGAAPGILKVLPKSVTLYGQSWATQFDAVPLTNIPTFGGCAVTGGTCAPKTTRWEQVMQGVQVLGQQPLLDTSTCQCLTGGLIKIYFSHQAALAAGPPPLSEADAQAEQKAKEHAHFWGNVGAGLLIAAAVVGAAVIIVGSGGTALAVLGAAAATGAAVGGVGGAVAGGISGGPRGAIGGFFQGALFGALGGVAVASGAGVVAGALALGAAGAGVASLGFLGDAYYHNPSHENGLVLVGAIAGMVASAGAAKGISVLRSAPNEYLYREDNFPYSNQGRTPDRLKSYVDEEGNLSPANPNGKATIQDHVRGSEPRKSDSPYTSTSAELNTAKSYGDHQIRINKTDLERDINSGKVKDVEIVKHEDVISHLEEKRGIAQERYDQNPTPKNKLSLERAEGDIANSTRDKEVLVKGTVPAKYVKVTKKTK